MSLLKELGGGQGYLKAGLLGFQSSGKTWTSILLAIGLRKFLKLDGPIAMFDTEAGSEYVAPIVLRETGKKLIGVRSRSFDDLCKTAEECVSSGVSVLVADSMTHVWRELCQAYLKQINDRIQHNNRQYSKNRPMKKSLEFQDWNPVKEEWARWTDFYINSQLHIVICGRAGYEYEMSKDEDTGKKELNKVGIKMKTEGEFGFEPSLLVEMEREQIAQEGGGFLLRRRATIIKDRFGVIDGKTALDPTFEFFKPHIALLTPGAHAPVDTSVKSQAGSPDEDGDTEWTHEKRERVILCEEIRGELLRMWPGETREEKTAKLQMIEQAFGTRSWTKVEGMRSDLLRTGLAHIRGTLGVDPEPGAIATAGNGNTAAGNGNTAAAQPATPVQAAAPAKEEQPEAAAPVDLASF